MQLRADRVPEGLRLIPARRVSGRVGVTSPLLRRPPCVISVSSTGIWRRVVDVAERKPRSHGGREALASSPQLSDEPLMVLSAATYGCNTSVDPSRVTGHLRRPLQPIEPVRAEMDYFSMEYPDFCGPNHARQGQERVKAGSNYLPLLSRTADNAHLTRCAPNTPYRTCAIGAPPLRRLEWFSSVIRSHRRAGSFSSEQVQGAHPGRSRRRQARFWSSLMSPERPGERRDKARSS